MNILNQNQQIPPPPKQANKWINKYKPQNTLMEMTQKDIPIGSCVHQSKMEGQKVGQIQYFRQGNNKDIN